MKDNPFDDLKNNNLRQNSIIFLNNKKTFK